MKKIKHILKDRSRVANLYGRKLKSIRELEVPYVKPGNKLSWFVYVVKLAKGLSGKKRDRIIAEMGKAGIKCGNYFQPIHLQPFYKDKFNYGRNAFPITEDVAKRTLALPFYNSLSEKEVDFVVDALKNAIEKVK